MYRALGCIIRSLASAGFSSSFVRFFYDASFPIMIVGLMRSNGSCRAQEGSLLLNTVISLELIEDRCDCHLARYTYARYNVIYLLQKQVATYDYPPLQFFKLFNSEMAGHIIDNANRITGTAKGIDNLRTLHRCYSHASQCIVKPFITQDTKKLYNISFKLDNNSE